MRRWLRRRPPPDDPLERIVATFGCAHPRAFFVQIGSNDGDHLDPLKAQIETRPWRGIMVEPVADAFDCLRARHGGDPRIVLENVAISETESVRDVYHLIPATAGEALPPWYDQLGSFRKDVVLIYEHLHLDEDARADVPRWSSRAATNIGRPRSTPCACASST